jgi:hypothetical protein
MDASLDVGRLGEGGGSRGDDARLNRVAGEPFIPIRGDLPDDLSLTQRRPTGAD